MSDNDPDFSMTNTSAFGKCSSEVKTWVPEDIGDELTFLAGAHRMTKSEYVRNVLIEHTRGKAEMVRLRVSPPLRSVG